MLSSAWIDISTHAPLRGATIVPLKDLRPNPISTHAPLRGATAPGERALHTEPISTHAPLRGATAFFDFHDTVIRISTHAPLRGATFPIHKSVSFHQQFLLTHPCEVRLYIHCQELVEIKISTHAPLRGATDQCACLWLLLKFLLTHPCEVRRTGNSCSGTTFSISTHAPLRGATKTTWEEIADMPFLLTHPCEVRPLYIASVNSRSSKSSSRLNLFEEILSLRNFLFRCYRLFQANHLQFSHLFRFAAQPHDVKELRIFKSFKSVFSFSVTVNRFDHICLQQSLNQIRCRRSLQIKRFHDSAPAKDTLQSERRK